MSEDLITASRHRADNCFAFDPPVLARYLRAEADEIESLRAQLARARKALEEITRHPVDIDDRPTDPSNPTHGLYLKIGPKQYAEARAALKDLT